MFQNVGASPVNSYNSFGSGHGGGGHGHGHGDGGHGHSHAHSGQSSDWSVLISVVTNYSNYSTIRIVGTE